MKSSLFTVALAVLLGACDGGNAPLPPSGLVSTTKPPLVNPAKLPGAPPVGDLFTTQSGLQYYELKVGDGAKAKGKGSKVIVRYTGWLTDGDAFDSSHSETPLTWRIDQFIPGFAEGVGPMRSGGKRKLIVPARLGYGGLGTKGIPGGATLVFDIELVGIKD